MSRGNLQGWIARSSALAVVAAMVLVAPAWGADDESVLGQDGGSLILVLDGSGSMKEPAGDGRTRMEAAKEGLVQVIDKLPDDSDVGLRVYGSTISDGPGSCEDSELLAPVEPVDKSALRAGVQKLQPLGNTPIAYSLQKAYEDLPAEGPRSIVLVSDGEENCDGDPCAVARDLRKKGAEFYVDVVGLQVDATSRNQLTCIASAGGGTYYDVKEIEELDAALTRTSVRAARGYEPAGLPVEGSTDAQGAPQIEDGQWLDTIGDTGTEHYTLPDADEGTLHASAAMPPSAESRTKPEVLEVSIVGPDGQSCSPQGRASVQGLSNGDAPVVAATSSTPQERTEAGCDEGGLTLVVDSPTVEGTQTLEVFVRTEPGVESTQGLPSAVDASGFSDEIEGDAPSGEPVPVIGGPNFTSAPPTAPGTYADTILAGETLLYRVPDVGWGQSVVCDFTAKPSSTASAGLGSSTLPMTARTYGPLKSEISDSAAQRDFQQYDATDQTVLHAATPPVRYLNRESPQAAPRATAVDGDHYCALSVRALGPSFDDLGEIPVELTVSVVGDAEGAPEYATDPQETANERETSSSDDGGVGWPWIALGAVVLVGLLAALFALLRRRARPADPSSDDAGPPR